MGYSRSARIKTLLVIDTAFFFLEAIVGYSVGSLALVADSFHMLNDVMSLIVALYALKLAENTTRSNKYSYGWQRAEILGALINGVFLLALCFTIFMEAIQRIVGEPDVANPKLVVIVGSAGLLSNIVGLFLFHDHGHSHGGHAHSHSDASAAEQGHSHTHHGRRRSASVKKSNGQANERSPLLPPGQGAASPTAIGGGGNETPMTETDVEDYDDSDSLDDLLVHPARTREAIVRQAYDAGFGSPRAATTSDFGLRRSASMASQKRARPTNNTSIASVMEQAGAHPTSQLNGDIGGTATSNAAGSRSYASVAKDGHKHSHNDSQGDGHVHEHDHESDEHEHGHEEDDHEVEHHDHSHAGGHGHSHGNMNMRGVFLHVLGDALGNVGVIGAGLIIWLTKSPYRFYSDPIISLIITCIIFSSALPLVRSASFILLQGTPSHVPLEKVRSAILRIPNVISVHDLHIWSLSESKLVASLHILVRSNEEFQQASFEVRKLLHRFGVHSSTIQPELLDGATNGGGAANGAITIHHNESGEAFIVSNATGDREAGHSCTVQCVDDSCVDNACCPPAVAAMASPAPSQRA